MNHIKRNFHGKIFAFLLLSLVFATTAWAQSQIKLNVDAGEAAKNILHIRQTMPVKAGQLTLFYPKWIPGEHSPTGPINDVVNFFVTADGKPLRWTRDDVEMFAFRVEIPAGVTWIEVAFDNVSQPNTTMTANLARIKWNRVVMYPLGEKSDDVTVTASLKLPAGWDYATALITDKETTGAIDFKPVSLTRLIDSPAIIGKYFLKIPLSNESGVPHEIDIAAETAEALKYKPETLQGWKNLVREAQLMYGARHYNSYKFLLTLSDYGGGEGLEHHESSEDGVGEKALSDQFELDDLSDLLGHEYTHSWNGKYRRPAGLATPDFNQPMKGELLWVYEGLTQYLGKVLPSRAGLWKPETYRESLAETAASLDNQTGRRWRPLVDTARAVQFTYDSPRTWRNARRRVDYYDEGSLIWLEADVLIREKSGGKLSLDNFLRKFHGGQNSAPEVKPYDLAEVVRTLNEVFPYDWQTFFGDRVYAVQNRAPLSGITNGGWQLVYNETPNTSVRNPGFAYSLGLYVTAAGAIADINPDLPAYKAGLAPGMVITSVNDVPFSLDVLRAAIRATKTSSAPIKVTAVSGATNQNFTIAYTGGERYPHLVRDTAKTDYITAIISSKGFITQLFPGGSNRRPRGNPPPVNQVPTVRNVTLNQTEFTAECLADVSKCPGGKQSVDVAVEATDPENDVLTYNYTISGGKTSGTGAKIVWNLEGLRPGTYTIAVSADDGCGICGNTITKTITVK